MAGRAPRRMLWAVLIVLALVLLPPFVNVNRYRSRVTEAISRALGRNVTVSTIELKLLPRPGLVLSNFVLAEDPVYGAEPMLRADTVTAYIRFSSLWRGRLEIGTLDLDTPSLNLVRRGDGHWNLEELVGRASQVSAAPTTKIKPESRPRFPYVQASTGRINFKLGLVKKSFAFTDADFALWQDSEDQWGIRLKGRPVRTDVGIGDTGTFKLEGRFQRASALSDTPLDLRLTFSGGPLGQLTKLIYGVDRGWRGTTSANAVLSGTPAGLSVTLDGQVEDFRRYDIALGESLTMRVHCTGSYSSPDDAVRDVQCQSPVGPGIIRVRGNAQGWLGEAYDLGISAEQIPADRLVAFARHAKKDLPSDLTASGDVEGVFSVRKLHGTTPVWSGGGQTAQLALHSDVLKQDLTIGQMQFAIPSPAGAPKLKRTGSTRGTQPPPNDGLRIVVKPFALSLGAASPATASASFDREHYDVTVSGDTELARLLNVAKALGIATPGVGLAGTAQLDLAVAGTWAGFAPPVPSGKITLRNASAELQGINEPIQITTATVVLNNQEVSVTTFAASFGGGPAISGSASFPEHCTAPETCVVQFDARSDDISLARLNWLANPNLGSQPWYHLLTIGPRQDALLKLHAHGRFSIAKLEMGSVTANDVSGTAQLADGKLRVSDLRAELLGGRQSGTWTADFTVSPPAFSGSGTVSKLSMTQLATLMRDSWAAGTVDGSYQLTMSGLSAEALRNSAAGLGSFTWTAGSLRHFALDGRGTPITFTVFSGKLALQNGTFLLSDGKMQSSGATYAVTGTALYDRTLDFRLERAGGRSYVVSGTLDKPIVAAVPAAQAEAALR